MKKNKTVKHKRAIAHKTMLTAVTGKRTKINDYRLRKVGFKCKTVHILGTRRSYKYWRISLDETDSRGLVYKSKNEELYLDNVYLNYLRIVKTMEQIEAIYNSLTDETFARNCS